MKAFVLGLALVLIGCGGTPQNSAVPTIKASQVFSNHAETWAFVSQCQNMQSDGTLGPWITAHTWIEVQPQPDTIDADGITVIHNTTWHYTKDQPCAYWMPNSVFYEDASKPLTELYFFMSTDASGAWYSTGGHIIAPNGFPWDTTVPRPPQDLFYQVAGIPGQPRPYLILGNSGTTIDTVFPDITAETRWQTIMSIDPQNRLLSCQWEGPRINECWHFQIGRGLVYVEVLNQGGLINVDPKLNLSRIN